MEDQTLNALLDRIGERATPVYAVQELGKGKLRLWLCSRTEPIDVKPTPKRRRKKATQ